MPCEGCVGAVRRVLTKLPGTCTLLVCCSVCYNISIGVEDVDISLEQQKVVVRGQHLSPEQLIETVAKTGKETTLWTS